MSDLMNPTATEVRQFLNIGEGNEKQIYHDPKNKGYPTHGLGVNLQGKSRKFLLDYITNLGMDPTVQVDHYVFNGTTWAVDTNAGKKYLVDEILWLCNETNTTHRPFDTNSPVANENLLMLNISDNPNASAQAFDQVVYQAYLGGTDDGYNIVGVRDTVNDNIWEKLTKRERLALYSLNYNSPVGSRAYIGPRTLSALDLYTNGSSDSQKFIGKLCVWYQILYCCNSEEPNLNHGIQNRRFFEANEFLEKPNNSKPNSASKAQSIIPISSYEEANIAIAFMNQNKEAMKNKLDNITNYKSNSYKYIRDNFRDAITTFMNVQNYTGGYDINTLFTEWNLYTDLQVNTSTGTTSYGKITGSDKKDLIFVTGDNYGIEIKAGEGDDFVSGSSQKDIVNSGTGNDVIYTYAGNDEVYTTESKTGDYNQVYLGAGSDTFRGGDGDDYVDGGSGHINWSHVCSDIGAEDATTDINDIDLGGGQNRYIGGKGIDIVQGNGYNTVFLGAGSDKYIGGDGVDIVDGGSAGSSYSMDSISDTNTMHLGGGNDQYYGGIGKDIVNSGNGSNIIHTDSGRDKVDTTAANEEDLNKVYLGAGGDTFEGGKGRDIVNGSAADSDEHDINEVRLGGGNDEYYGGAEVDKVRGGSNDDEIFGGANGDFLYGDGGNDTLDGGEGNNELYGGTGNDKIYAGSGNDTIKAGTGSDYVNANDNVENLLKLSA